MHFKLSAQTPEPVTMERDLVFRPAREDQPLTRLSRDQVRAFNRDGFVARIPLFAAEAVARHRASFDRLLELYHQRGANAYHVNNCHTTCGSIWDLAVDSGITAAVGDLLDGPFACWSTHFFCKLPHDESRVSWHQDAPYWPFTPARTVTAWLAIDDVDPDNGAMQVIPGSHAHGALPMRNSRDDEKNVLFYTVDGAERFGEPVSMRLKSGEASLHADMILHGSPPNLSGRRRRALALRYCTTDVRSDAGWNRNSVMIRGTDPTGYWGTITQRPQGENPFTGEAIGNN